MQEVLRSRAKLAIRFAFAAALSTALLSAAPAVLQMEDYRHWIDAINRDDAEEIDGGIADAQTWNWLKGNIPFFTCPDASLEQTYYYRWWAYRKHIETTPDGYVITEFLRPVKHATEHNAISCALGLHIAEGRWLRSPKYLDDYIRFWLHGGPDGTLQPHFHQFSGWLAAAVYDRWKADGDRGRLVALLDSLLTDYRAWVEERRLPDGLFWQRDVSDGMEESISGGRRGKNIRPSIDSYMFGNARAIAAIARLAGRNDVTREYEAEAGRLRRLMEDKLWNPRDRFFETVLESGGFAGVREAIGFTPWYFDLPEPGKGYEEAWKQLADPKGFYAPYGMTTAEQRAPGFRIANTGDDCQWNGPSWPFATSLTLSAAADVLLGPMQTGLTRDDYWKTFQAYTAGQHLKLDDGRTIPWVDENLNPFTGVWQARAMKIRKGTYYGRGDHYNHSAFADLVITGLAGLRPRADDTIEVNPLAPPAWDWFCLDQAPYHGHLVTIVWDRTGRRFGQGRGLRILVDGREVASAPNLGKLTARL
jgi:hypothetical protein